MNIPLPDVKLSFLDAQDPNFIEWNRQEMVKIDLRNAFDNPSTSRLEDDNKEEMPRTFTVHLRIKPISSPQNVYNLEENILICNVPDGCYTQRNLNGTKLIKKYSFTNIFGPNSTQVEIFNSTVKGKLINFINGKNSTILTYGVSGSGKTYTIVGTDAEPGLIPRALEYLFRSLANGNVSAIKKPLPDGRILTLDERGCQEVKHNRNIIIKSLPAPEQNEIIRSYNAMRLRLSEIPGAVVKDDPHISVGVWVTFAEIYNEYVYDLLVRPPTQNVQRTKLSLGDSKNGQTYIKNLTTINVSSGIEAFLVLQYGLHNLKVAATVNNMNSSRSHSIFTIKLVQSHNITQQVYTSYFNFCDLAGSERSYNTKNIEERQKEANNINTSLLVLGRCIKAVRTSQKQNSNRLMPFRDSKLTRLFQRALSGLEDISMIVNVNPSTCKFDETHHVLNFSAIAKDIIIEKKELEPKNRRFSQYLQRNEKKDFVSYDQTSELSEENMELQQRIADLENEVENNRIESERINQMERERALETFEILKESYEKEIRHIKARHDAELRSMKKKYEEMLVEPIVLSDSSDSESESDSVNNVVHEETKKQLTSSKALIAQLQDEKQHLIYTLREKNTKIVQLENLLQSAEEEFKELNEINEGLRKQYENLLCQALQRDDELV